MNKIQLFVIGCIGAGLWACSSVRSVYVQTDKVPVTTLTAPDDSMEAFIAPYKEKLAAEMDRPIGYATGDLKRDRPEGALGNFVVDATLDYLEREGRIPAERYICIMNNGGLRSPISSGTITVGDIYKLMPFDNTVVVAKLPVNALDSICQYLASSGGEPIAGFTMENGSCELNSPADSDTLYVVTSDYLFNGGDHMDFFEMHYSYRNTGVFLRDMLIREVEVRDTIQPVLEERITLE
ncbi:MAG: 5'-nucleotidase C-terminal domain-containing protein [Bacteroidota bacterium]